MKLYVVAMEGQNMASKRKRDALQNSVSFANSLQIAIVDKFSEHQKTSKDLVNFVNDKVSQLINIINEQDHFIASNKCNGCDYTEPLFNRIGSLEQDNKEIVRQLNILNQNILDKPEPRSYAGAVKSNNYNNFGQKSMTNNKRNANVVVIRDNNENTSSKQCMEAVKSILDANCDDVYITNTRYAAKGGVIRNTRGSG